MENYRRKIKKKAPGAQPRGEAENRLDGMFSNLYYTPPDPKIAIPVSELQTTQTGKILFNPDWPLSTKLEFCYWVLDLEKQRYETAIKALNTCGATNE